MSTTPPVRVALLVVRCWNEDGTSEGFRARLTELEDVTGVQPVMRLVSTPEEVLKAVSRIVEAVRTPRPTRLPGDD